MTQWPKYVLAFAAGVIASGTLSGLFVARHWNKTFENSYVLGVADQANVAREIYAGRSSDLAQRILASLPEYVLALDQDFSDTEWFQPALWLIQDAYGQSGSPVPPEIEQILAALPVKPPGCCELPPRRGF